MDIVPAGLSAPPPTALPPAGARPGPRPADEARARLRAAPETLHPGLWLGHQLGRSAERAEPSGFAELDAQLPGGGWPRRGLTELLLPHPGVGEIRLLAGCLAATQARGRLVMLFDPPAPLSGWALAQLGLEVEQLLVIDTRAQGAGEAGRAPGHDPAAGRRDSDPAGRLWALEQALASGHVGAVLAWLPPRLRSDRLRRLQLAAAQAHDGPAFVLRELDAARRPSPAPLRLALRPGGPDMLSLQLLKRRGPPLESPLTLELPPVLSPIALQRAQAGRVAPAPVLHAATFVNLA